MNNAGITGALVLIGAGLFTNAFMAKTPTVQAVPVSVAVASTVQDEGEPTIVWYDSFPIPNPHATASDMILIRAWSDGLVEGRTISIGNGYPLSNCEGPSDSCIGIWIVISSPTDGLNAAADINFDEMVDGQDLAVLLASWGEAPRNPMPPSDCPLGLMN